MEQTRIDEIYDALDSMNIRLPKHAESCSTAELNDLLVDIRTKVDEAEKYYREAKRNYAQKKKKLTNKKAIKKIELDNLLVNNEEVKKQKNQGMREAVAESQLSDLNREIMQLDSDVLDLSILVDTVKSKLDNLNALRVDFRRLMEVLDMDIKLSGGSEANLYKSVGSKQERTGQRIEPLDKDPDIDFDNLLSEDNEEATSFDDQSQIIVEDTNNDDELDFEEFI